MRSKAVFLFLFLLSGFPFFAYAHEVYVLSPTQIAQGISAPPFSLFDTAVQHLDQFAFWALIGALIVGVVFSVSISKWLESQLDPILMRVKKYAPLVARITVALAFFAAAYYGALFGPELPLTSLFGAYAPLIRVVLMIIGLSFASGRLVRTASFAALCLFAVAVYEHGTYMLTYTNYLGEIMTLMLIGHTVGVGSSAHEHGFFSKIAEAVRPYRFLILRVAFGISLLYASIYAKILHNQLAFQVASLPLGGHTTSLAQVFGFDPHFLVLGAAIVEIIIGAFFLLGIEIRFTALFLEFWLVLSLIYFGEVVWPHIILIGIPISFILYGYDRFSLEGKFFKNAEREPVL